MNTLPELGAQKSKIVNAVFIVILLVGAFLFVKTISEIKAYTFIGGGVPSSNTVTVSGEGEVFIIPDIANFSFSVIEEAKTVPAAQETATKKMNAALAVLKSAGIEEKDIQTTGYNIYPQYDYLQEVCTQYRCPPGRQELRGYEVSQTISVKIRDTSKAGTVLAAIGGAGASNISGLTFTVDDEDVPLRDARKLAINDAQVKAEALAKDLGVRLVRIVSFSEGGATPYYFKAMATEAYGFGGADGATAPEIPVGENRIVSNVSITYEIR